MAQNRTIEIFTAGCSLCSETAQLVKDGVQSCGCDVIERQCSGEEQCAEAKAYGVRVVRTVVVDGEIIFEGKITRAQAALLSR